MATLATVSTIDRLGKGSNSTMGINAAATTLQLQALADGWDGILVGADVKLVKTSAEVVDAGSQTPPNDVNADRKNKWLYRIQDDTTGVIYAHELGCADNSQLPTPTTDFIDLTSGVGLALKDAIEAVYRSPDGNSGVLLTVQQVNRTGN